MTGTFLMVLAQAPAPAPAPSVGEQFAQMLPMFVLIVVIFYFVIYRPQKQQREKHQALISQLKKGDKVVTTGGIWGTVTNVGKETVTVQVAENAKIKVARDHILRVRGDEADD
ncbi:MAG: preprotein translocase subunit YajC [Nitrospirae bacterium]|nr:MAG: preprotein translocase subunit YajC [Nitrospirota bacterium]